MTSFILCHYSVPLQWSLYIILAIWQTNYDTISDKRLHPPFMTDKEVIGSHFQGKLRNYTMIIY